MDNYIGIALTEFGVYAVNPFTVMCGDIICNTDGVYEKIVGVMTCEVGGENHKFAIAVAGGDIPKAGAVYKECKDAVLY